MGSVALDYPGLLPSILLGAAGEVVGQAKTQLRQPLQVLAQSKQEVEQLRTTATVKLTDIQQQQAKRDEGHTQNYEQQIQVMPPGLAGRPDTQLMSVTPPQ